VLSLFFFVCGGNEQNSSIVLLSFQCISVVPHLENKRGFCENDSKSTYAQLKDLNQQREVLFTQLKTDRTAKNTSAVKADFDKAVTLEQSVIPLKQQLLQDEQQISGIVNK
jgi:hypothetical protein